MHIFALMSHWMDQSNSFAVSKLLKKSGGWQIQPEELINCFSYSYCKAVVFLHVIATSGLSNNMSSNNWISGTKLYKFPKVKTSRNPSFSCPSQTSVFAKWMLYSPTWTWALPKDHFCHSYEDNEIGVAVYQLILEDSFSRSKEAHRSDVLDYQGTSV